MAKKKKLTHKPYHSLLFYSLVATPAALYLLVKSGASSTQYAIALISLFAGMAFVVGLYKYWQNPA